MGDPDQAGRVSSIYCRSTSLRPSLPAASVFYKPGKSATDLGQDGNLAAGICTPDELGIVHIRREAREMVMPTNCSKATA